jgi:hypothetical protein
LRLANVDFTLSDSCLKKLFPVFRGIKTLEVIKCKINIEFLNFLAKRGIKISKLIYIDNFMATEKKLLRSLNIKLKFVTNLICCSTFTQMFDRYYNYWENVLGVVPNCEELTYYKKK